TIAVTGWVSESFVSWFHFPIASRQRAPSCVPAHIRPSKSSIKEVIFKPDNPASRLSSAAACGSLNRTSPRAQPTQQPPSRATNNDSIELSDRPLPALSAVSLPALKCNKPSPADPAHTVPSGSSARTFTDDLEVWRGGR